MSYEQEYRQAKRKGDVRKVREMRDGTVDQPVEAGPNDDPPPSHPEHAE